MIEIIKNKIWDLLKEKEVSLAMIYDRNGKILWHAGRAIKGETIDSGEGFCKNAIKESIKNRKIIEKEDVSISSYVDSISEAVIMPSVKKLIIQPLNSRFFLYIDSGGTWQAFTESELEFLKAKGEMLAEIIFQIKKNEEDVGGISGKSGSIEKVRELVLSYSMEEEPVLLLGETGVGKNYIAELIHRHSGRRGKFVVAGAPTLQENLFESTLFGHKKGAFTDAKFDKEGLVEEAREGTLFIDEISEVPISLQAKLLRFIESKKYRVLGEAFEREADVRIIAASNKDLLKAIEDKEFREDLYYRLNILEITIPPLRERKEDIEDFLREKQGYLRGKEIGSGFLEALVAHEWPGNFREFITVLKRAGISSKSPITGVTIRDIINQNGWNKITGKQNCKIDQIWNSILSGRTFWEAIKKPFLDRELNRSEVKEIIRRGVVLANGRYKSLIKVFNLIDEDYHKFMTFLKYNRLR